MRFGWGSGAAGRRTAGADEKLKLKLEFDIYLDMQGEGGASCTAGRVWAWDKPD